MKRFRGRIGGRGQRATVRRSAICAIAALLFAVTPVGAQSDDLAEDFELTVFVWGVVADEHLGGRDSISALTVLKDLTDDYHQQQIEAARSADDAAALDYWRDAEREWGTSFFERYNEAVAAPVDQTAAWVVLQILFDGADDVDPTAPADIAPEVSRQIDDAVDPTESAIHNLVGHDLLTYPDAHDTLSTTLPALYNPRAGLPVSSSEPVVDTPADAVTRPVRFDNTGSEPATVKVASYRAGPKAAGATASAGSTVVFPSGGSSAALELPVGTYTFCYEWQVDGDADGDGRIDFAHASTAEVSLGSGASDDPASATTVTISPESATANGRCGESITHTADTADAEGAEGDGSGSGASNGTTPEELANEGLHTYSTACVWDDGTGGDIGDVTISISYDDAGMTVGGPSVPALLDTASYSLTRAAPNSFGGTSDGYFVSVTMTSGGAAVFIDYGDFFGTLDCTLTRTS